MGGELWEGGGGGIYGGGDTTGGEAAAGGVALTKKSFRTFEITRKYKIIQQYLSWCATRVRWFGRRPRVWLSLQQGLPVGDHDFDHHVGELDVHDGSHRLLLRPEQGGSEADAQVGDGHEVLVRLLDHVGEVGEQDLEHPLVGGGQLLHKAVDLI